MTKGKKIGIIISGIIVFALVVFFFFKFLFVFGEGVKAGQLNYVVRKGYVFKTYEGKLIQSGFRAGTSGIGSNEFVFSIQDKDIAEELMKAGGRYVELHYKEYLGKLPWRGYSKYIVDEIVNIKELDPQEDINSDLPPLDPGTSL